MSKGSRRREARRRAKQRRQAQQPERPLQDEGAQDELRERPGGDEEPVRSEEAAGGRRGRTARKRAKRKDGFWERVGRIHISSWMIAVPVLVIGTGVLVVLIVTSGSSGTTGGSAASTPTPDPRLAGTPVAETVVIVAGDSGPANPTATSFFRPDTITANAGEVIEIELRNEGSVTHNIWLAGVDEEYGTKDDWGPIDLIPAGETGRLRVGIDEPGTYVFQCEIHQQVQFGTLTLE